MKGLAWILINLSQGTASTTYAPCSPAIFHFSSCYSYFSFRLGSTAAVGPIRQWRTYFVWVKVGTPLGFLSASRISMFSTVRVLYYSHDRTILSNRNVEKHVSLNTVISSKLGILSWNPMDKLHIARLAFAEWCRDSMFFSTNTSSLFNFFLRHGHD
jgi:hypothetical protein